MEESMDIPKAFALLSVQGEPAGVMLMAPDDGGTSGDCMFMLSPASADGIESDMGKVVSALKVAGEHQFNITMLSDGVSLIVLFDGQPQVEFQLNQDFQGSVITKMGDTTKYAGLALPL
jgi:hypothetical protein